MRLRFPFNAVIAATLAVPMLAKAQDIGLIINGVNALFSLGRLAKQTSAVKEAQTAQAKAQAELQTRTEASALDQSAKQVVRDQKLADYKARGWMFVTENQGDTLYIGGDDLQLGDDEVEAWLKTNFAKPIQIKHKTAYSSMFNVRYDCKNRTFHNEQAAYYNKKDSKGRTVAPTEFFPPMDVARVVPDSVEAKTLDFVCALR